MNPESLNIGFLYVIFEQKRSCDQIVGDLEFELEGYFQRRLSHGIRERNDVKFQVTSSENFRTRFNSLPERLRPCLA